MEYDTRLWLEGRLDRIESRINDVGTATRDLAGRVLALIDTLTTQGAHMSEQTQRLITDINELRTRIDGHIARDTARDAIDAQLTSDLAAAQATIAGLTTQLATVGADRDAVHAQLDEANAAIAEAIAKAEAARDALPPVVVTDPAPVETPVVVDTPAGDTTSTEPAGDTSQPADGEATTETPVDTADQPGSDVTTEAPADSTDQPSDGATVTENVSDGAASSDQPA